MHGSLNLLVAIKASCSNIGVNPGVKRTELCRVVIEGDIVSGRGKIAGEYRTIWWHIPGRPVLEEYLQWQRRFQSLGLYPPKDWNLLCALVIENCKTEKEKRKLRYIAWKHATAQWDIYKGEVGGPWKKVRA